MEKHELLTWLESNPRKQRKLERLTGLSHGYFTNMKKRGDTPTKATLNLIALAIKQLDC